MLVHLYSKYFLLFTFSSDWWVGPYAYFFSYKEDFCFVLFLCSQILKSFAFVVPGGIYFKKTSQVILPNV